MELTGKVVVVLAEETYEDLELWYPYYRMREAGATAILVGTGSAEVYASKHGYPAKVDARADDVRVADVDAVIIPGGFAPDRLRRYPAVLKLVREVAESGKVVAAICHAGWVLVSAGVLKGRTATSVPAIKDDMANAGATWVDREVVRDGNLITSRTPADLPPTPQKSPTSTGMARSRKLGTAPDRMPPRRRRQSPHAPCPGCPS